MSTSNLSPEFQKALGISRIILKLKPSGQKQVYIVEINGFKRALKILPCADNRIERELKIYDEFANHEGIPKIIQTLQYSDEFVIVEEYIEGKELEDIKGQYLNNSLKVKQLMYNIIVILDPVWKKRYVHRDLKPNNIIITSEGNPVILDFGIARDLEDDSITPSGNQPFTPLFASPEQFDGKKELIGYRTDFFCLGIIAYYLFTGKFPFGTSKIEIAKCFQQDQITFNVGDVDLNNFLNATLSYSIADRPRNIDNLIMLLNL